MLYIYIICSDPNDETPFDADVQRRHEQLERELRERGQFAGAAAFLPVAMSKIVRRSGDEYVVTDGVPPDASAAADGFYLIDCNDEDEAMAYAARIPVKANAWVQVRRVALWHGAED